MSVERTMLLVALALGGPVAAQAETGESTVTETNGALEAADESSIQWAIGVTLGWQERRDYGNARRSNLIPEIVGFGYLPTSHPRLYLRPGVRLGYSGLQQPEYARGLSYREDDAVLAGELGVLYDALVIPSLTVGAGLVGRRIEAASVIDTVDTSALDGTELQPMLYAQIGTGLSFGDGSIVLEPFVRYEWVRRDARIDWRYGLEATVLVF